MSQFESRATFTVPAGSGSYAPERIQLNSQTTGVISPRLSSVAVLVEVAVATAVAELWLLKAGAAADPTNDANYFLFSTISSTMLFLPSWRGAQIRVKSGGTAGNLTASVVAAGAVE